VSRGDEDGDGDRPGRVRLTAALLVVSAEAVLARVRLGLAKDVACVGRCHDQALGAATEQVMRAPRSRRRGGCWTAIAAAPTPWAASRVSRR
jgi:hypothetical protein